MDVEIARSVMIIGKTGSGKSTLANFLTGHELNGQPFSVSDGQESNASYYATHCMQRYRVGEINYVSKIVDTRGLFDTKKESFLSILEHLKKYLCGRVDEGINLLIFVMRQGRFTDEEKKVFDIIMNYFEPEISDISALVITHCEMLTQEQRKTLVEDFKTKDPTKRIAAFMKKGVYDVGFTTNPQFQGMLKDQMKAEVDRLKQLLFECKDVKLTKAQLEDLGFWVMVQKKCIIL